MAVVMKTRVRQLREELQSPKVSQETMARRVGVTLQWYRQIECGQNTSFTTAKAVLSAINTERQLRRLQTFDLDELDLRIV